MNTKYTDACNVLTITKLVGLVRMCACVCVCVCVCVSLGTLAKSQQEGRKRIGHSKILIKERIGWSNMKKEDRQQQNRAYTVNAEIFSGDLFSWASNTHKK